MRRVWLLVFGSSIGLLIVEIGLRLIGVSYPQPYIPDPDLGTRLQPGFAGWFAREGRAFVEVNSAGFRDRERSLNKPDGAFRIVVLGDSYAEAVQVPVEQTFWSVLEQELNKTSSGKPVEVLNFGISGFGTAQELETLRHVALKYEPDLVLVAFLSGNDVRNNSKALEPVQVRPFYHLADDKLTLDVSFRENPLYLKAGEPLTRFKVSCINSSRVLQLLYELKNRLERTEADNPAVEAGLNPEIYAEPTSVEWQSAWQLTERLLVEMNNLCSQSGCDFAVVTLTNAAQVHPDDSRRQQFARQLNVAELSYPDQRLAHLGQHAGFSVIVLADRMAAEATRSSVHYHGFENTALGSGHWNKDGHKIAGQLIAEDLTKLGHYGTEGQTKK